MRLPPTTASPTVCRDARQVRVPALEAEAVLDHDEVAVAAVVPARECHDPAAGGADGVPDAGRNVDAGVPTAPDPAEPVPDPLRRWGAGSAPARSGAGARTDPLRLSARSVEGPATPSTASPAAR